MKQSLPIILSVLVIAVILGVLSLKPTESSEASISVATLTPSTQPLIATPTPDEFPGWEIYTNRQHNFSIRVPENWLTEESQLKPFDLKLKVFPKRWQGQQLPWANSANITVDSSQPAKKEFKRFQEGEDLLDNEIEEVEISNQTCLKITNQLPDEGGFGPRLLCFKNNRVYQLQIFSFYPPPAEKELAREILTSFKFLN